MKVLIAVLLISFPTFALASVQKYHCKATAESGDGWVPKESVFQIDSDKKSATAHDPMIHYVQKQPMVAEFEVEKNGTYKLRWKVRGLPVRRTRNVDGFPEADWETKITIRYVVEIDPETKEMSLRGYAGGLGKIRATGHCKLVD